MTPGDSLLTHFSRACAHNWSYLSKDHVKLTLWLCKFDISDSELDANFEEFGSNFQSSNHANLEGATGVANEGKYTASHWMPLIYSVNSSPLPLLFSVEMELGMNLAVEIYGMVLGWLFHGCVHVMDIRMVRLYNSKVCVWCVSLTLGGSPTMRPQSVHVMAVDQNDLGVIGKKWVNI